MRTLLFLVMILITLNVKAWIQSAPLPAEQCKVQAPYGFPSAENIKTICREAYYIGYDDAARIPKFVSYVISPKTALGCVERSNAFVADMSVSNSATPDDYVGSGYDKGHQAPNGDLSYNTQVESESFLMTNMAPQLPGFNRSTWKLLETSIRAWTVETNQSFTVYVGSVYNSQDKKIGKNQVVVPHAFYKIVIADQSKQVAGWMFPHRENLGTDLSKFRMPVADIEKTAAVKFALPLNFTELKVNQEWAADFGQLTKLKKQTCSVIRN